MRTQSSGRQQADISVNNKQHKEQLTDQAAPLVKIRLDGHEKISGMGKPQCVASIQSSLRRKRLRRIQPEDILRKKLLSTQICHHPCRFATLMRIMPARKHMRG